MSSGINKTTLKHLAKLAHFELSEHDEDKLLHDLEKIIGHFDELSAIESTGKHTAVAHGVEIENVFRDDAASENTNQGKGVTNFPESHNGFLRIPPVFEK